MKQYDSRLAGFSEPMSDYIDHKLLATAGTAEDITVPVGAKYMVLSGSALFYARSAGTATLPASDVADGSGAEAIPVPRTFQVVAGQVFSVVAPANNTIVSAAYYG